MQKQPSDTSFSGEHSHPGYRAACCTLVLLLLLLSAGCVSIVPEQNITSFSHPEKEPVVPFSLSGTGNGHSNPVYLSGITTILAEVSGTDPFILSLHRENKTRTILFHEPGSSLGTDPKSYLTSRNILPGNYTISIISGNAWNIFLNSGTTPQYVLRETTAPSLTGSGSQSIHLSPRSNGLMVLRGYGTSPGYISAELLVNENLCQRIETDATGLLGLQAAYPLNTTDTLDLNITSDSRWIIEITRPAPVLPMMFEPLTGKGNYVSAFYRFSDRQHQELAFSNTGNTSALATLYTENGTVLAAVTIPAGTHADHYRLSQDPQQILPVTALLAITAEPDSEWLVEPCDYRVYFKQISPEDISQKHVPRIQDTDLLELPILQRFAETGFTAAFLPASNSEIQKLMATNYTTIECAGTRYSLSVSD